MSDELNQIDVENTEAENDSSDTVKEVEVDTINYDHFSKLDIRIGTIIAAEVVPEADRLLRLEVDLGEENPRQIVSGIREFFADPEELVGRQCPFVTNLEPRMIKGYESQGMIMAASTDDTFALLNPHQPLPAGTKVN